MHQLPDFYFENIGIDLILFDGSLQPFEGLVNEDERKECRSVLEKLISLLGKYQGDNDKSSTAPATFTR